MGKILDFLSKLGEAKFEITDQPIITNNYFITIDNRVLKVTKQEFNKYIRENNLKIEDKTIKLLEAKDG